MDDTKKMDHLERTQHNRRHAVKLLAEIIEVRRETPTVKSFVLRPHSTPRNERIAFLPGQWLDVFIPGVSIVGGFSITSAPRLLERSGRLQLAVKYSNHPPAEWFHDRARVGDTVEIRVGGDFVWDTERERNHGTTRVVMIAGGVGINPLMAMLEAIVDEREAAITGGADAQKQKTPGGSSIDKVYLLYSVRSFDELLFLSRIQEMRARMGAVLECAFFVTRERASPSFSKSDGSIVFGERITSRTLLDIIAREHTHVEQLRWFVCGPGPMEDAIVEALRDAEVHEARIAYEKWW